MRTKKFMAALLAVGLILGVFALTGCSGGGKAESKSITGEWEIKNSSMVVVINDTEIKLPGGNTIPYKLDSKEKTITLSAGSQNESKAKYELSDDGKTLTIIETVQVPAASADASGSAESTATKTQEIKTIFTKISDNKDAEPRTNANNNGSSDTSATK